MEKKEAKTMKQGRSADNRPCATCGKIIRWLLNRDTARLITAPTTERTENV